MVIGAAGSVCVMLYSSRNSDQQFLKVLFTVWVLSPFLLLELGDIVSERWHLIARPSLYWTMVIVAVGSLAIYILAVLRSPEAIPTPVFVATPPISGLVIAAVAGIACAYRTWGSVRVVCRSSRISFETGDPVRRASLAHERSDSLHVSR